MFEPFKVYHNASVGSSIPGSPIVESFGEFQFFFQNVKLIYKMYKLCIDYTKNL